LEGINNNIYTVRINMYRRCEDGFNNPLTPFGKGECVNHVDSPFFVVNRILNHNEDSRQCH